MTLEECLAKARAVLDEHLETVMAKQEALWRRLGCTEDESEANTESSLNDIAEWRAKTLADIEAWLRRDGNTLQ